MHVHPLTRRRPDGTPLQRSPQVEAQIVGALALSPDELIQRAALRDSQTTEYLQEETLVYLIRAFHRFGDSRVVNAHTEALLRRCTQFTHQKLRALGKHEAEEAYGEVIRQLFERILDPNTDRGDFLQVRFWFVLKRLTISVFGRYKKRINEGKRRLVPLAKLAGDDLESDDDVGERNQTGSIPMAALLEPEIPIERKVLGKDGLNAIQEPYRTAFILHYYHGWQIESNDPCEPTLSKYFDKTPRTIHNWLTSAEKVLEKWRGEPI
jgi:DNA-directed RNA polymerase specialized sigma24 family protein